MNTVTLIGRLTADPTLRRSTDTTNVSATMRVAVDRHGTNGGADFITVVAFGTAAENHARYLAKGRLVAIGGRLHHNTWTDDAGNNRERYEVIARTVDYLDAPKAPETT